MQEEGITALLQAPGDSGVPGVTGTRCLSDNLSDLRAQVAANAKGISLVQQLISESSLVVVQRYMHFIQSNAEAAVRQMLTSFSEQQVRSSQLKGYGSMTGCTLCWQTRSLMSTLNAAQAAALHSCACQLSQRCM